MRKTALILLAAGSVGALLWLTLRASLPESFAGYERGFGDTILRYKDRSYEGAKWEKMPEADSLGRDMGFADIAGWDDDNFAVTNRDYPIQMFRVRAGSWSRVGEFPHEDWQKLRFKSAERMLFGTGSSSGAKLWDISFAGNRQIPAKGKPERNCHGLREIALHSDDLFSVACHYVVLKSDGYSFEVRDPLEGDKEQFLHTRANVPLDDFSANNLYFARSVKPGRTYAYFKPSDRFREQDGRLGVFENGLWYESGKLPFEKISDMWLGFEGREPFAVLVGSGGWVHLKTDMEKPGLDQPVNSPAESTSTTLLKVWGVSPRKYWVMDSNGTVWERSETDWRTVVRGLKRDDVEFLNAWVSPTGNVYALAKKHIYRLK